MASLAAKDSYLQNLAKKICSQQTQERQKRKFASKPGRPEDAGPPKKKKKKQKKQQQEKPQKQAEKAKPPQDKLSSTKQPAALRGQKPAVVGRKERPSQNGGPAGPSAPGPSSFLGLDILRQRLREKIQEARGQGSAKELSPATLEKRRRRKQEKERKKRKRKELKAKEKAAEAEAKESGQAAAEAPAPSGQQSGAQPDLVFNRVEVGEAPVAGKAQKRKEKRQQLKGKLTPLTGKNYRQLLERLEARKNKLEDLKDQDPGKAQQLETKMRWTNLLYKAEGVKIRDDEGLLKAALKRKEKRKAQRQRQWEKRTEQVVEKMQRRQDKRRSNIRKKKTAKLERRKDKARKKGRVLPEDLEKAGLK
ncbi:surfeit locus protein 6 [Tachyglossus aculeatus]|uniref:surfeit locus protein 6 n=1 Tax=Tachyglossus aculeatus TaxID=9261 RepID=UPI0018F3ED56|nr:surfeit locus protein 6 [Tachyglossus aculeatus]XP_038601924.1 surfeit locus protein 6 [Tachyglossus aculeatus]